jgi:hypothetical protein
MIFEDAIIFAIYAFLAYIVVLWVHYSAVKDFDKYKKETDDKISDLQSKIDHLVASQTKKNQSNPPPKSLYQPNQKW